MKIVAGRARPSSDTPTLLPHTHSAQNQQLDRMKMHSINLPAPMEYISTQAARSRYISFCCARRSAKGSGRGATSIRAPAERASLQPPVRQIQQRRTKRAVRVGLTDGQRPSGGRLDHNNRIGLRRRADPGSASSASPAPLLTVAATMLPRCRS